MLGSGQKLRWWHALWQSFYSKTLYQYVAVYWRGWGAFYLLVLSALIVMPATWHFNDQYQHFVDQELPYYLADFPDITVENGVAKTPENHPYILNHKDNKTPFIVIDTSGQYTNPDQTTAPVLITATQILFKQPQNGVSTLDFADFADMTIDRGFVENLMDTMGSLMVPLTFLFLASYVWSKRIVLALVYGVLAAWLGKRKGLKLPYRTYVRISAVTLTPAILFDVVAGLFFSSVPLNIIAVLFIVLEVIYLRFAIQSVAELPVQSNTDDQSQNGILSA